MNNETKYRLFDAIRNDDISTIKELKIEKNDLRDLNTKKFSILKMAYNFESMNAFKYYLNVFQKQNTENTRSIINSFDFSENKNSNFVFLYELSKRGYKTNVLKDCDISKRKYLILKEALFTSMVKRDRKSFEFIRDKYYFDKKDEFNSLVKSFDKLGAKFVKKKLEEHCPLAVNEHKDMTKKMNTTKGSPYNCIQCVSYSPATSNTYYNKYNALDDDKKDWQGRISILNNAIKIASNSVNINNSPSCLKVFMIPEFYFRGKKGGYSLDTASDITHSLGRMVMSPKYKDWLFVFGTTVAYSKDNTNKQTPYTAYNFSVIQKGGNKENEPLIVMKENISHIDYASMSFNNDILQYSNTKHLESFFRDTKRNEHKDFNFDSNSIFEIDGIRFGVEICLDNIVKRIDSSKHDTKKEIDVLLVPSCGVGEPSTSKSLSRDGIIFTVDGAEGISYLNRQKEHLKPLKSGRFIPKNEDVASRVFSGQGNITVYPTLDLKKNMVKEYSF